MLICFYVLSHLIGKPKKINKGMVCLKEEIIGCPDQCERPPLSFNSHEDRSVKAKCQYSFDVKMNKTFISDITYLKFT